jgi:uncharacterized protein HemY
MAGCTGNNRNGVGNNGNEGRSQARRRRLGAETSGDSGNKQEEKGKKERKKGMEKMGEGVWRTVEKNVGNSAGAEPGDLYLVGGERKSRAGRVANAAVADLLLPRGEEGVMASGTE